MFLIIHRPQSTCRSNEEGAFSAHEELATTASRQRYAVAPFSSGNGLSQAFNAWRSADLPGNGFTLVGSQPRVEDLLGMRLQPLTPVSNRLRPELARPAVFNWPPQIIDQPMTRLDMVGKDGRLVASGGPFADYLLARVPPEVTRFDALAGQWLPRRFAVDLSNQLDNGAVLLWAALTDGSVEQPACQAMLQHCDGTMQVHDLVD